MIILEWIVPIFSLVLLTKWFKRSIDNRDWDDALVAFIFAIALTLITVKNIPAL